MPSVSDTAYPRFKINPSAKELNELYTPTVYELAFARERARQPLQRAGLLLLLKTFQRLGYFALCAEIPAPIIRHIFRCAALVELPEQLQAYDASTARDRHTTLIREFLGVTAYGPAAREVVVETCLQAARTRDDLPDLINMAIEELIRQRFELPAFSTLLRIARTTRNTVNRRYQLRVCELLDVDARQRLLAILSRPAGEPRSLWDQVKREPKRSTVPQFKDFLDHLHWLQQQNVAASAFAEIPEAKIRQFAAEARSLDLTSLNDMPERKRLTLAGALILKQVARALDDVTDMFIRQVNKMHHKAEEALMQYQVAHADRTDALIAVLREITLAYKAEGSREERLALIETLLEKDADQILAQCMAHEAVAGSNHLSFLPLFYSGRRSTLFLFLESTSLVSTTQDRVLLDAIAFLLAHKGLHSKWLAASHAPLSEDDRGSLNPLDLSFVADKWRSGNNHLADLIVAGAIEVSSEAALWREAQRLGIAVDTLLEELHLDEKALHDVARIIDREPPSQRSFVMSPSASHMVFAAGTIARSRSPGGFGRTRRATGRLSAGIADIASRATAPLGVHFPRRSVTFSAGSA